MEYYNILKAFKGIREGSEAFVEACHEFEHYICDKYFRGIGLPISKTVVVMDGGITAAKQDTKMARMAKDGKKSIQNVSF